MRLIDADALKEKAFGKRDGLIHTSDIDAMPTVDAVTVVRGSWTERSVDEGDAIDQWQSARCSVCGRYHTTPYMYYFTCDNFCPYCGADMREEKGDEPRDQTDINRKGE